MSLTKATLRDRVRLIVGNPKKEKPDELLDTSIEDELDSALRQLDNYVPDWRLYYICTEDDTQIYNVESGVTKVLDVYWFGTSTISELFGEEFDVLFGIPLYDIETGYYKWCLDWLTKQRSRERFDWEFNTGSGKLYLIPEPEVDAKAVYYLGSKPWTWDSIPAGREDIVVRWATAQCLKMLGRRRQKLSGIGRRGGMIDYGASEILIRDGQWEEEQVRLDLEAESMRFMAGF